MDSDKAVNNGINDNEYKHKLLVMINALLAGEYDVLEFRESYYDFYVDEVPDSALDNEDSNFFGSVQEKLDWVDETPDSISQEYGWINYQDFVEWLKDKRSKWLHS